MHTHFITICRYHKDINSDKAKGRSYPSLRGTWLPSLDKQISGGVAINWFGVRIRVSLT